MSLKSSLQTIIKDRKGEVFTLKELEDYCHKAGYKLSNAERRLRESPVEPVYNSKHTAIIGYKAPSTPNLVITATKSECCYSFTAFKIHAQDCPIMDIMKEHAKILEANENLPSLFKYEI